MLFQISQSINWIELNWQFQFEFNATENVFDTNLWNIKWISYLLIQYWRRKNHIFIGFRKPFMNMCFMYFAWKKLSQIPKWMKWKRLFAILFTPACSLYFLCFLYFHKKYNNFNKTELMTSSYFVYLFFHTFVRWI